VEFEHHGMSKRFGPEMEIAVFRIVQEAVHNVVKHAGATEVRIYLTAENDLLQIRVTDNGSGFDVEEVLREKAGKQSLGILGIQERTALLHGTFGIESSPGAGTTVNVTVPLGPGATA